MAHEPDPSPKELRTLVILNVSEILGESLFFFFCCSFFSCFLFAFFLNSCSITIAITFCHSTQCIAKVFQVFRSGLVSFTI